MVIYDTVKNSFLRKIFGVFGKKTFRRQTSMKNTIVLRTNDEVNADLAHTWCDDYGLAFLQTEQHDPLFPEGARGVAIDLNHLVLGRGERAVFVERLCKMKLPCPVAIASYDLEAEEIAELQSQGVLVFRRVDRQLFFELEQAVTLDVTEFAA